MNPLDIALLRKDPFCHDEFVSVCMEQAWQGLLLDGDGAVR